MDSAKTLQITDGASASWWQRYRIRSWLRRQSVFVRSCRVLVRAGATTDLLRLIYLSTASNYALAEQQAEEFLQRALARGLLGPESVSDLQWKRGRMLTHQTLAAESEQILHALERLRVSHQSELLVYDRVADYRAPLSSSVSRAVG